MAATTNINVSVDSVLKQEAENLLCQMPNEETRAALDEYEEMKNNPDRYKRYESFDEVLDEVFADA